MKIRHEKKKQGADEGEKEKRQDGVVKVKPHVCKRSLTSASALYSFLTAARIPAVGPGTESRGVEEGLGSLWWTPRLLHPPPGAKGLSGGAACGVTLEFYS